MERGSDTGTRLVQLKSYLSSVVRNSVCGAGEPCVGGFLHEAVMSAAGAKKSLLGEVQALRFRVSCRSARRGWCEWVTSRLLLTQKGLVAAAVSVKRVPWNCGVPENQDFTSL